MTTRTPSTSTSREAFQHISNSSTSNGEFDQRSLPFVCACHPKSIFENGKSENDVHSCKRVLLEPVTGNDKYSLWIKRHGAKLEKSDLIKLYLSHKIYLPSQLTLLLFDIFPNLKAEFPKWDKPNEVLQEVCRILKIPSFCSDITEDDDEKIRVSKWIHFNKENTGHILQYYFFYCRQARLNIEVNRVATSIYKDFVKLYNLSYHEHYFTFDDEWLNEYLADHPAYEKNVLFFKAKKRYHTDIEYAIPCTFLVHTNRPIVKPDVEFLDKNGKLHELKPKDELVDLWKDTYLNEILYDPMTDDVCDCLVPSCEGCQPLCIECNSKKCMHICRNSLVFAPTDFLAAKNPDYFFETLEVETKRRKLDNGHSA